MVLFCSVWCGVLADWTRPANPSLPLNPHSSSVSPAEGAVLDSFLTAVLRWEYPQRPESVSPSPFLRVNLQVADNPKYTAPLANVDLDDHQTSWRVALVPEKKYYWRLTPFEEANGVPNIIRICALKPPSAPAKREISSRRTIPSATRIPEKARTGCLCGSSSQDSLSHSPPGTK